MFAIRCIFNVSRPTINISFREHNKINNRIKFNNSVIENNINNRKCIIDQKNNIIYCRYEVTGTFCKECPFNNRYPVMVYIMDNILTRKACT